MPRPPRRNHDGAIHHVIVKGCHGEWIVHGEGDRRLLLSLFADACELFEWRCLTYCLLSNHMHLVLKTPASRLSEGMQHVCGTYARAFGPRKRQAGPVFQRPFKSYLVRDDAYFATLARYVAFNPVRHKLCQDPCDWGPSAHPVLLGRRPRDIIDVSGMFEVLDDPAHYARLFDDLDAGPASERDRAVVRDARMGYAVPDLCRRHALGKTAVYRILNRHGITPMKPGGVTP